MILVYYIYVDTLSITICIIYYKRDTHNNGMKNQVNAIQSWFDETQTKPAKRRFFFVFFFVVIIIMYYTFS